MIQRIQVKAGSSAHVLFIIVFSLTLINFISCRRAEDYPDSTGTQSVVEAETPLEPERQSAETAAETVETAGKTTRAAPGPATKETQPSALSSAEKMAADVKETPSAKVQERLPEPKDDSPPAVTILSPKNNSCYASRVTITGQTGNSKEDPYSASKIESLAWEMAGTGKSGSIVFEEDGKFEFEVSTIGRTDTLTIVVKAGKENGTTSAASVRLLDDGKGPYIALTSPLDGSSYGPFITISGMVSDSESKPYATGEVKSLSFYIEGRESQPGDIEFSRHDGTFNIDASAKGLSGTLILAIRAEDLNGNVSLKKISLLSSTGPYITITSPEIDSFYRANIAIVGRVGNTEDNRDSAGMIQSLSYKVLGQDSPAGEIDFDKKKGTFSFDFSTKGFSGTREIEISATDLNSKPSYHYISLRDGNAQPGVSIMSPHDGSSYGAYLSVSGKVTFPDTGDVMADIKNLYYEVSSAELFDPASSSKVDVEFERGGAFSFNLPTKELKGSQVFKITAEAWNGNKAEQTVTLTEGESDISSFTAVPANHRVSFSWDPLPESADYTLYYTTDGSMPSEESGFAVNVPASTYTLSELENGVLHIFRLKALSSRTGEFYWSDYRRIIPLSPSTLKPKVTGEYGQIRVSWIDIPGADTYDVLRSTKEDSNFSLIAGEVTESVYVDRSVQYGKKYFYKVKPALYEATGSESAFGETLAFPVEKVLLSGIFTAEGIRNIAVQGDYVYTAEGKEGIKIIDIADAMHPEHVAACSTGNAKGITVAGDHLYVADGEKGFKIFDVTDPRNPALIGSRNTSDAHNIAVHLSSDGRLYAYIADGKNGVKVLDTSDPRRPNRVCARDTYNAVDVAVGTSNDGKTLLYVADGEEGLKIFNISDPKILIQVGSYKTHNAGAVAVRDDTAYVADGSKGLKIIDTSSSDKLSLIGSYDTLFASDISVTETTDGRLYAFLADSREGLKVLDISDPGRPYQFDSYKMEEALSVAFGVNDEGDLFTYIADSTGLKVIKVLLHGTSFQVAACDTDGKAYSISISGSTDGRTYAYVADHKKGIKVIDVTDPSKVGSDSLVGFCGTDYAEGICVLDNHAYVADGFGGLKVIDVSPAWDGDPASQPVLVKSIPTADARNIVSAAIGGSPYLLLADGNDGLRVFDISDRGKPTQIGYYELSNVRDLAFIEIPGSRSFVYAAAGKEGIKIIDLSHPAEPVLAGAYSGSNVRSVKILKTSRGRTYLFAVGSTGLEVLDISEPASPARTGVYATEYGEGAAVIETSGGKIYAFLAEGYKGLKVLDVTDPRKPVQVSACTDLYAVDVQAQKTDDGDLYAFIADTIGIKVVHVLIPPWL